MGTFQVETDMGKSMVANTRVLSAKFTATVSFSVTDYGPVVFVETRVSGRFCDVKNGTDIFGGPTFRRAQEQNRGQGAAWIVRAKGGGYKVVTPEYLECYTSGKLARTDKFDKPGKRLAKDPKGALENGDFHLVVRDKFIYDHNLYGLDGRVILRPIRVDHIYGHLQGTLEAMEIIANKLRTHDQVTEVTVSRHHNSNADFHDQHGIEYLFTPTPRQFTQWGPGSEGYESDKAVDRIRKLVKCGADDFGVSFAVVKGSAQVVALEDDD